jgi:glycosyl transferase family 25
MGLGVKRKLVRVRKQLARKLQNWRLARRWRSLKHVAPSVPGEWAGLASCDVIYINLDHREDRRHHIESELARLGIDNYTRLSAVRKEYGALGCALSHLKALGDWQAAPGRLLMVCEDDCTFLAERQAVEGLIEGFARDPRLEVLCLAYNNANEFRISEKFCITSDTQTTACYVVKPSILSDLRHAIEKSVRGLEAGNDVTVSAVDIVWKELQQQRLFCFPVARAAAQVESYSDIEGRVTDYGV